MTARVVGNHLPIHGCLQNGGYKRQVILNRFWRQAASRSLVLARFAQMADKLHDMVRPYLVYPDMAYSLIHALSHFLVAVIGAGPTLVKVEGFDNADQFPVNTEEKKEGTGSAMVAAAGANPLTAIENIYSQKKDLSFYQGRDDAYLRFWLYVADASLINRNQDMFLEIGSGGGWASGIARYSLADTDLQNGWNELYIPVSAFERHSDPNVTECDWSAVNYIRLYMFSAGAAGAEIMQTMGIDGMYIGLESDFEVPPESTSRVIEDFDSPNKFTVDTENKKEGDGSAVVEVSGEGDVLTQIESAYAQPKNLTRYIQGQDAYLHLWVYLEDASLLNRELDGYLEIGSGGAWNSQISRYDVTGLDFKDGWNELLIPVSEMQPHSDPAVGGCDWSHVNYMRFYLFNTTPSGGALNQTMRLDGLSIGLGSDFSDAQPVQPVKATSPILIEGYDNGKKFHVSTNNYKQGVGAAMSEAAGSGDVLTAIESTYTKPKDLSLYAGNPDAYIHVWLYVDDAALINRELDGYLEIGSGGTWNAGIARYDITQLALEDGWNELFIPVTAFERHGDASITPCDWSHVNYVRLYMFSAAPSGGAIEQTLGIDGLYIGWKSEFPDAETVGSLYTDGGYRLIEGYNDARKFQVNTQNKKEGYGSAMAAASGEGDVLTLIESTYTKPKDLSSYIGLKNAYVHIWLYVEDVSLINREADGYLEIGSGGVWNAGIARYDVTQLALQDGWNELLIPVSAFERHSDPSVTPCDWSHINYVRLYLYSAAPSGGRIEQTVGVDELTIGTAADFADVTPVGARYSGTEYRLVESYDDARKFQVSTSNKKEGYGAAMATASGNENVLTVIESTYTKPKDLSAFADNEEAYIQFWLYVEDAAAFNRTTDAYLEFSSGGAWNSQVSRFNLASLENLADGWNEILIPVHEMEDHTDPAVGGCDWSRINYIRVYLFSSIPGGGDLEQTMGVDGLGIGLASDFELPEKDPVMLVEPYDDPHRFTINTEDFKEGTGAAMVETDTAGSVLTAIETAYSYTKDMSEYAASSDGCVSFWLYLEDVSYFNRELDGFMEFSSGGSWAAAVARYDVTKLDLQNGWNHVVIPLSEFDRSPDPTFEDIDWSSVNYIRFYLFNTIPGGSAPQKLIIDGLQAGHMADFLTDDGTSVEGLHSDAVMLSNGYGQAASAGAGIPAYIWWIVGGAGAVVVAAAVTIPVVVVRKKKKNKKQPENPV